MPPFKKRDPRKPRLGRFSKRLLDFDARVDHSLFAAGVWLRSKWDDFSAFMDRFHVAGIKRVAVEGASEGMTLGTVGLIALLALAVPAFRETSDDDWLKRSELAVSFLDRYGQKIGERGIRHNDTVPLEEFPDHLIKATLATEDRRFFEHFGIDFAGTFRALGANLRAQGVVQGGSSITQQLAKNLFLNNERTLERKVKEAFLAVWLETRLSKKEILKLYLDRAYLGGGTFGVDGAAQFYFNKSARDVTLAESAMLAGLFKAPARFAPHINLSAARARASVVLDNLVEAGFMTEGQVFGARRNPARSVDRREEDTPNYYLDYAYREIQKLVDTKLGKQTAERVFVVRTGFDPGIQRASDAALESSLRQFGKDYGASQGAIVIMQPDGLLRAMTGGRDYGESQFNRATDAQRQPGSSFKPYVYAAALMNGYKSSSIILDGPLCIGNWCPQNYSHSYAGPVSMLTALTNSFNTPAVRVSQAVGRDKVIALMRRMGITSEINNIPPLALGAADLTVMEMTRAYAHFANKGRTVISHAASEIRTPLGEVIWRHDRDAAPSEQVLSAEAAEEMNLMLHNAVEAGTGRRARIDGIYVAGKTGTTNAYRDAWFMGYTGNFVGGVWFGNDDYTPTRRMTGGSLPAMTWQKAMAYAHQGIEPIVLPGLKGPAPRVEGQVAAAPEFAPGQRPTTLSSRSVNQLLKLERLFREAPPTSSAAQRPGRSASATDGQITGNPQPPVRGN